MPDQIDASVLALLFSFFICVQPVEVDPCCSAGGEERSCQLFTNGQDPRAILSILESSMHCVGHVGLSGRLPGHSGIKTVKHAAKPQAQAVQARLACSQDKCHLPGDGPPGVSPFNGNPDLSEVT